jgi:hypothetical protein
VGKPRPDAGGAPFTKLQGQYLAYIHTYTLLHRQPPAERDMQLFFQVTPPAVHSMVITLERVGLLARTPGKARSLRVLLPSASLPALRDPAGGPEDGAAQQGDEADKA